LAVSRHSALAVFPADSWCGKIQACVHHPQIVVGAAVRLGLVSVALGALGVILGAISVWPRSGPSWKAQPNTAVEQTGRSHSLAAALGHMNTLRHQDE